MKASRSRSTVMWCKSAVNFTSLSRLAIWRTPSSALCTRARHCVRCVFCWLAFSLTRPCPSTASEVVGPPSFGSFAGTLGLCDFPCSFIGGLWPWPFRRVPSRHLDGRSRDLPVLAHGDSTHASAFPPPLNPEFLDRAKPRPGSLIARPHVAFRIEGQRRRLEVLVF